MERENFGGRLTSILVLAGSAIGLGNIWRFPYMVGENGGAAFVLIYVVAGIFLSLPIFFAEFVIGRRTQSNCLGAMKKLAPGSKWRGLGLLCILTPILIVSYYSVVGGWSLEYLYRSCTLSFLNTDPDAAKGFFGAFISKPFAPLAFFLAFLLLTVLIVAAGIRKGIGHFSKVCIPILFVLIVVIAGYSMTLPGAGKGIEYLVRPDLSKITPRTFIDALGQSFYSMSLGMGIVITYSSYIKKDQSVLRTGLGTALSDVVFAILAGFAVIPAVFAAGIEPGAGAGLVFESFPFVFVSMSETMPVLSSIMAILFFFSIVIAAMTSSISLVEVGVAYLVEERKMKRVGACAVIFIITAAIGTLCSLSFGPLSGITLLGENIFGAVDRFCSNVLLTAGGLLIVLFVGWKMKKEDVRDEFTCGGRSPLAAKSFGAIYFVIRYFAPVAMAAVLISNLV